MDYHLIELLQWDHIYTAPYFLALLALLGASLAACTSTRQWPMVRVARRYGAESCTCVPALLACQAALLCQVIAGKQLSNH